MLRNGTAALRPASPIGSEALSLRDLDRHSDCTFKRLLQNGDYENSLCNWSGGFVCRFWAIVRSALRGCCFHARAVPGFRETVAAVSPRKAHGSSGEVDQFLAVGVANSRRKLISHGAGCDRAGAGEQFGYRDSALWTVYGKRRFATHAGRPAFAPGLCPAVSSGPGQREPNRRERQCEWRSCGRSDRRQRGAGGLWAEPAQPGP